MFGLQMARFTSLTLQAAETIALLFCMSCVLTPHTFIKQILPKLMKAVISVHGKVVYDLSHERLFAR